MVRRAGAVCSVMWAARRSALGATERHFPTATIWVREPTFTDWLALAPYEDAHAKLDLDIHLPVLRTDPNPAVGDSGGDLIDHAVPQVIAAEASRGCCAC